MNQKCRKAIIMAGGFGTRRLPVAKAIDKSMLPIGNRPLIDYIVEDLEKAGITEIMMVVSELGDQIKAFYAPNPTLEEHLQQKHKLMELDELRTISAGQATISYLTQPRQPYGTAAPIWLCRDFVSPNEQVLIVSGDQFFYHENGGSEAADLLARAEQANTSCAMLALEVPISEVHKYGVVEFDERDGQKFYQDIIEKPAPESAPSNLVNASFYLVTAEMFAYTDPAQLTAHNGEYYLTDAFNDFVRDGHEVAVFAAEGEYMDCGQVASWIKANNRIVGLG